MNKSASAIAALSAAFTVAAIAQTTPPPRADIASSSDSSPTSDTMQFGTVDQNKDGRISRSEAMSNSAQLGGSFATLDADRDTYLSQAEYGKWSSSNAAVPGGNGSELMRPTPAVPAQPVRPVPQSNTAPNSTTTLPGMGTTPPGNAPTRPGNAGQPATPRTPATGQD